MIFISSAADNMNMVMAMSRGADDFIAKPFDMDVLVARSRQSSAGPIPLEIREMYWNIKEQCSTFPGLL